MLTNRFPNTCWRSAAFLLILGLTLRPARAQVNVTTFHNDYARDGQNLNETILNPANVASSQFGRLFVQPVDGYAYAQPLYVANLAIAGGTHNVVYVATEHDSVYAFDADSNTGANGSPLWQVSFINPAAGINTVNSAVDLDCSNIAPEVGITGTPVIDLSSNTLYVVAKTNENGVFFQRLHALDITSGAEKFGGPVVIAASVPGSGDASSGGQVAFDPLLNNQRAGLLLLNGMVYIAWASHCDISPFHGWMMAYNAATLAQVAIWNSTPNGSDGGVWQSGAPPAVDSSGYVYLGVGNGTFDLIGDGPDAGDSIVKFGPPGSGKFPVLDYFTPYNEFTLSVEDTDLGSGGVVIFPDQPAGSPHQHLLVEIGKQGSLYLVNRDLMGHFNLGSDTQIVQWIQEIFGGLWGTPAFWNNTLYVGGTNDALQAFAFNTSTGLLSTTPVSASPETYYYPGSTPSISANGTTNGIVWALEEDSSSAILHAYDATNLASELYNSSANASQTAGPPVNFAVPTVVNGKVYVGTATQLAVYGLVGPPPAPPMLVSPGNYATGVSLTPVLSWDPVAGATSYDVYFGTSPTPPLVVNTTGSSYTPPALLVNTVYYWTIAAHNLAGVTVSATWSFTTVATPGPPVLMSSSTGLWERTVINSPFPLPLQALITDAGGNGIAGLAVTFAAPASGASVSFAGGATVTTDAQGLAVAPAITANAVAGSFVVTATAGSLSTMFNLSNLSAVGIPDDFNGDGLPDIVWQDPVGGSSQVWFLNGLEAIGSIGAAAISGPNTWRIVAVADFNGDGQPDVVWQDPSSGAAQVWFLGSPGTSFLGAATIALANPWRIVAAADFNLDGYPDLVWQDPVSGAVQIWYMGGPQGTTVIGAANITASNAWKVVGAGDFNGDGYPDLLWQDPVSGSAQIWYLSGAQGDVFSSAVDLSGANPWRIVSVADYNLDGHPDVVWQDPVSGESQVWFLNGVQGTSLLGASALSGPNTWRIVGPR
ncbi:MAG: FG-GAP-like repeat-containing protein [Bryobacteraceae bacterium]